MDPNCPACTEPPEMVERPDGTFRRKLRIHRHSPPGGANSIVFAPRRLAVEPLPPAEGPVAAHEHQPHIGGEAVSDQCVTCRWYIWRHGTAAAPDWQLSWPEKNASDLVAEGKAVPDWLQQVIDKRAADGGRNPRRSTG